MPLYLPFISVHHLLFRYVSTYTPEPSRPCSPEMVCQKAAPIWLPFHSCQSWFLFMSHRGARTHWPVWRWTCTHIAGQPVVSALWTHRRGARVQVRGLLFAGLHVQSHASWRVGDVESMGWGVCVVGGYRKACRRRVVVLSRVWCCCCGEAAALECFEAGETSERLVGWFLR